MSAGVTYRERVRLRGYVRAAALILSLVISAYVNVVGISSDAYLWLTWFTLVPLFAAIKFCNPLKSLLCGGLWGLTLCVCSVVRGDDVSASVWTLSVAAGVPALYTYIGAWLTRRIGFSPLVLGVAWIAVGLALEPLGVHTGSVLATQADGRLIHWIASAFGYIIVAFLFAYVSALLLSALTGVRIVVPRVRVVYGAMHVARLVAQTFACLPPLAIRRCRPRAPPGEACA